MAEPNQAGVTATTYVRTHEGRPYLAVVVDLFSRQMVGWSMGRRIDDGLVLDALVMAWWRCRAKPPSPGVFNCIEMLYHPEIRAIHFRRFMRWAASTNYVRQPVNAGIDLSKQCDSQVD